MANRYLDLITKNTNQRLKLPSWNKTLDANFQDRYFPKYKLGTEGQIPYDGVTVGQIANFGKSATVPIPDVASKSKMGLTTGDIVGMAGTIAGGISQISNSLSAAKATKKNVNRFKGFNEKALSVNKKLQNQIDMNESDAKRAVERKMMLELNTAKARTRGMSSSISGLKANDLATDVGVREAKIAGFNEIENIFGQQKVAASGQEQGLLTQQDQMVMDGQERVDDKDQMDLDNAYSNYAQNLATITQNMQSLGSNLNQAKHRRDFLDILPDINPWGIGYEYQSGINGSPTMTSKMYNKGANINVTEKPIPPVGFNAPFLQLPEFDFNQFDYSKF
jgi:hypothetical protein